MTRDERKLSGGSETPPAKTIGYEEADLSAHSARQTLGYEHGRGRGGPFGASDEERVSAVPSAEPVSSSAAATLPIERPFEPDSESTALRATEAAPAEFAVAVTTTAPGRTRNAVLPSVATIDAPRPRYEERDVLGEGGMGEVVLAVDHDIGREVAIKRLLPELDGATYLSTFAREVRTVGALEHPNIVPIHDVDVDEQGRIYFVMKRVEGETLEHIIDQLIARDPEYVERYSIEARMELFMGVLRALEFAHSRGVLHRDVKPANIMVGPYGEVLLMDWGVAVQQAELDESTRGVLVGTPLYMSPEQARGETPTMDRRSDLYSACVVFYELCKLRHYLGELQETPEVLDAVGKRGWRRTMMDWHMPGPEPMPPMEIYHFLRKGLAYDPQDRYPSAAAMLDILQRTLEGRVRVQCHLTFLKRTVRQLGRFVDRHPWLAFALFVVILAGTVYNLVGTVRSLLS